MRWILGQDVDITLQRLDFLHTYLRANRTTLREIAEHLHQKASMDCEEFYPHGPRALLPEHFTVAAPPEELACLAVQQNIRFEVRSSGRYEVLA